MKKTDAPSSLSQFDHNLQELERLVERMEHGEQGLEESLREFEAGIALVRGCREALAEVEQKVEILMPQEGGQATLEDFVESERE